MPLYSCAIVGTGTDADPFRPPFQGAGIGWICLGAPGTSSGRGLLYLPNATIDPRVRKIADDPTERVSKQVKTVWENELGITLAAPSTATWAECVAEILRDHGRLDGTRWGRLQPSKERSRYEIYLGALGAIWTAPAPPTPATQIYTESWPTDQAITGTVTEDQSWTAISGSCEVSGGKFRPAVTTLQVNDAICDSVLDTAMQSHTASFTMDDGVTNVNQLRAYVRCSDSNNIYFVNAVRRSTTGHQRSGSKRVASSNTVLVTDDATDPGASGTISVKIDGSTMTITVGSRVDATGTDASPQLLTNFKGGCMGISVTGLGAVTLDTHTIRDVAILKDLIQMGILPFARS